VERRAEAWVALHPDASAHHPGEIAADREAEAGAPNFRVVEPSACVNDSKMRRCFSSGMPIPVSLTENRSEWAGAPGPTSRPTWRTISPPM